MLTLAWRNIWRNFRRSVITVASMACGLAAIMFGQSMIQSEQRQLVEKATSTITGHIQIQRRGVREVKFPDKYIDDPAPAAAILAKEPGVAAFGERINITGLVSSPEASFGVMISAVQPDKERLVTSMAGYVTQGAFFDGPKTIVLGDKLAQRLDVRLGEKLVVMAQAADGSMGAEAFRVAGIYHTGSLTFDEQIVYVPLPACQDMLGVGGKINQLVARLNNLDDAEAVREDLSQKLSGQPLQVLTWMDIDHEILSIEKFQNALLGIVLLVIFAIVALGVLNTLLMSLFERVREFGVLMAIGARPRWVMKLVLLESMLLGCIGTVLGLSIGASMIAYFHRFGLRLPVGDALAYFIPFPNVIYLRAIWGDHALAAGAVLVTSLIAAIAPSLRACRLKPAEALRHV